MYVIDLNGSEYVSMCTTKTDIVLNGDITVEVLFNNNKVNNVFLADIDKLWKFVDNDEVEYTIVAIRKDGVGNGFNLTAKCIPTMFDYLNTDIIYDEYNGSIPITRSLDLIFNDTPYSYVYTGKSMSVEFDNFGGGENKLESLKRVMNRYGVEFRLSGNIIYIEEIVGDDTNILYSHRLNISDLVLDIDSQSYYTHIRGYGDFGESDDGETTDWKDAKLVRTYTSPLESIIGRRRHAPPLKDGRINQIATMDSKLKEIVDNSLKISVTFNIHQINKQGYVGYIPKVGDRVLVTDPRVGVNDEVRVVSLTIVRDWKDRVLDYRATVGSPSVVKRQESNLNSVISQMSDILNGKKKMNREFLDVAIINATNALSNAQTELKFPKSGGILSVDKNNPNLVTLLNSSGLGVSNDGGRTFKNAITGDGIVAERILAGIVKGLILEGGEVRGGKFITSSPTSNIEISNGILETYYNGKLTSRLSGASNSYYRDNLHIGSIGTIPWFDDPNYRGLSFMLSNRSNFMQWGINTGDGTTYDSLLSWHKTSLKGSKGFNFYDTVYIRDSPLKVGTKCEIRSSINGTRIGPDTGANGTYIIINENGQFGIAHGGSTRWL